MRRLISILLLTLMLTGCSITVGGTPYQPTAFIYTYAETNTSEEKLYIQFVIAYNDANYIQHNIISECAFMSIHGLILCNVSIQL